MFRSRDLNPPINGERRRGNVQRLKRSFLGFSRLKRTEGAVCCGSKRRVATPMLNLLTNVPKYKAYGFKFLKL